MNEIKYGELIFEECDGALVLTRCEGSPREIIIPSEVSGMPLSEIGESAFSDNGELLSVSFPEGVSFEIGEYAFSGCTALREVSLPEGCTAVLRGAFHSCTALRRVSFSEGTFLGAYAFANCRSLDKISSLSCASEGMLSHCASLRTISFSEDLDSIDEDALEHCEALSELEIPKNVTRIEALALRGCKNLRKIIFLDPCGWVCRSEYRAEDIPLDLSDAEENARTLSRMDFDDGVIAWIKK